MDPCLRIMQAFTGQAYEELQPFQLIEEESEDFDYYLKKFPVQYKYMLAFIAEHYGKEKVDDLSCLLVNSQSKYSSDIWIGQEELYEPLERVLTILKNDPKHKCFLQKVTAKEAPDYASIVKTPMDLGKMSRKLKDSEYKSKQQFMSDLNLIVSNCLLYNINPLSIFRSYAASLKDRGEQLLADVTDLEIRHKSELTPDELKDWVAKRAKLFIVNSDQPPLKMPEITINPLPELYQIPITPFKIQSPSKDNFFINCALSDIQTLFEIRTNYTAIEMLTDDNQMQVFNRLAINLDKNEFYNQETTFANIYPAIKQYLTLICLSIGFEQSSMVAIDLLADICIKYIFTLTKSFISHSLSYTNSINALHACLHSNGVSSSLLWQHLYEKYSYSRKLISVNQKLKNVLGGLHKITNEHDFLDEDGLTAGNLIDNVLNEDLFGLEAMGMGSLKIPDKLLKRKHTTTVVESIILYDQLPLYAPPTAMTIIYTQFCKQLEAVNASEQVEQVEQV